MKPIIAAIWIFLATIFGGYHAPAASSPDQQTAAVATALPNPDPFAPFASSTESSPPTTPTGAASQGRSDRTTILSVATPAFNAGDFVTQASLDAQLLQLSNSLSAKFNSTATSPVSENVAANGNAANPYAAVNAINNLSNVTIENANLNASEIPDLSGKYLSLSGGTVNGSIALTNGSFVGNLGNTYTVDSDSTDISVGDIVGYVNGKVRRDGPAQGDASNLGVGTPVAVATVVGYYESATALDSTHFVVAYDDIDNSGNPTAVVCTAAGASISCGTPVALASAGGAYESVVALDSTHFVVAYRDESNNSYPTAVVSSVSGTTITPGTPAALASAGSGNESVAALDSTHFVVAYADGDNNSYPTAVVSSVSGTTITAGTPTVLASAGSGNESVTTLDSTYFVVAYADGDNNSYPTAVVSGVAGTTITPGTPAALASVGNYSGSPVSTAALDSTHFVVAFDDSSFFLAHAVIGSVAGTTITVGTPTTLDSDEIDTTISVAAFDSTHFVVAFNDFNNNDYPTAVIGSVSGTTISAGTRGILASVDSRNESVAALGPASFVVAYQDESHSNRPTVVASELIAPTVLGMATNAASPGGTITVASNGIVTGLSGLTAGSTYYWDPAIGLTTTPFSYKVGVALSSSTILLDSNSGAASDQFFGDAVFQNGFRITEAQGSPQALVFKNQLGRQIASLDENGNLTLSGRLIAQEGGWTQGSADATTTPQELTATPSAAAGTTPWAGAFAEASTALQNALSALGVTVIHVFEQPIYAAVGIFNHVIAGDVTTDSLTAGTGNFTQELCITKSDGTSVCITGDQLAGVVGEQSSSTPGVSIDASSTSPSTSSPPALIEPEATSSDDAATDTPPVIQINGDNPALVNVGATYNDLGATITGPTADLNLGIKTYLNGTLTSNIVIDTSQAATDTIDYVATDQNGLTATSTRTVIVQAPASTPADNAGAGDITSSTPPDQTTSTSTPPTNATTTPL